MIGDDSLDVDLASKAFGSQPVLTDIRFRAVSGEVLALLAPSGTGKTTTLRIVLGLDRQFAGSVRRPSGRTGAVFQEPRLLPWMSVAANIRLGAPSLTDAEVDDLLALMELRAVADMMPKGLSLGMSRRVAIARALAVKPSLLVLDEPFASLDARMAATIASSIMARLRAERTIILFATHDLDQALAIADRILILSARSPATLDADMPASSCRTQDLRASFPFLSTDA